MKRIYLPTWNVMRTLKFSILVLMEDTRRLFQEQNSQIENYHQNPQLLVNPALFRARAKGIELLLLLGVTGEHLLKAILLKNGFVLNEEVRRLAAKRFPQALLDQIGQLGSSQNQQQLDAIYNSASAYLGQVSGNTISFADCIKQFNADIVQSYRTYFSGLSNRTYHVTNKETQKFFKKTIYTSNALIQIKKIRNNYAHLPDRMYEETRLVKYLYNFLVFIAKKEFPTTMVNLQTV